MVAFTKLPGFVEHLAEKVHNLGSDSLMLALSNTAPGSESTPPNGATAACVLANVTQVSYTNLSSRAVTITSSAQTAGTYSLAGNDVVLSAAGGAVATFRYVYLYNDTPTSPADPLIGYWDYGTGGVTLADGEGLTVDFTGAILTLA